MSKNKKKQKQQENLSQSVAALTSNGLKAFRQTDYKKAILSWEKEPAKLRPADLLAEAHFRYGLALFYGTDTQTGLSHLKSAAATLPDDPCYAYHVGLALHRLGDLPGALAAYQTARQFPGPFTARAAYPLSLALLQNGQDPTLTPAWNDLSAAEQFMLRSASTFRRRPYKLPSEAPLLWRSLVALDANDHTQVQAGLEKILTADSPPIEKSLAYYYRGVLAARAEDWDTASRAWQAASAAGLHSDRLHNNLAELYQRRAEDLLMQGDAQNALAALEEIKPQRAADSALDELFAQIHQHLGYQAAAANRWDAAQSHWQTAVGYDTGSFRLAYNLALAYEKSDNNHMAARTWREALRRRPRRADHPDALNDDQVARLWQRAAECYRKSGDFDEIGHTYQQAIKWAPENLNLRLSLAESLINDGRLQSARNELERLLERKPDHVPALLRLGEAYFRDENASGLFKLQAKKNWERVLQLEPKNLQVHQLMAEWYIDQAEIKCSWKKCSAAVENYQKALEYQPKNNKILVSLARCYLELDDLPRGEEYARQALAQAADFNDFARIIGFWLGAEEYERAWEITSQAEARFGTVPNDFYVAMAEKLLTRNDKTEALRWLERAIEKALPADDVLVAIGEMALDIDAPLALIYLQKALEVNQNPGQVHLLLGILESRQAHKAASKKHFGEAERIARKTNDDELSERIKVARMLSGGPEELFRLMQGLGGPDEMLRHLMDMGDPRLLEKILDDFEREMY